MNGSGIDDPAGNAATNSASDDWVMDLTAPAVLDVVDVSPDPRNAPVTSIDVAFSEPIDLSTFTSDKVTLTRNGVAVSLSGLTFTSLGGANYRVNGLSSATALEGNYVVTVNGTGIKDIAGNSALGTVSDSWTMDLTAPSVTDLIDVTPDPRNTPVTSVDVVFSEPSI